MPSRYNLKYLAVVFALGAVSILLWHTPVLYPFKVLTVFFHELGHGAAALLTGGEITALRINPDESGLATTRGGWAPAVASAGYVGSSLIGGLLLYLAASPRWHRLTLALVGAVLLAATLLYVRNWFALFYGLAAGGLFLFLGLYRYGRRSAAAGWLLAAVGVTSSLYAVYDLADLLPWGPARETDAVLLARHTGVPALVWTVVWACVSLFILIWFGRLAARRRG